MTEKPTKHPYRKVRSPRDQMISTYVTVEERDQIVEFASNRWLSTSEVLRRGVKLYMDQVRKREIE